MDVGAQSGGAVALVVGLVVGLLSWTQSRATNRRADFTAIKAAGQKVKEERTQRKLLTRAYLDLRLWARRVGPDTPAGPAPEPSADLDLTPWRP
ncbi:hypothetical protein SAMN04487983_106513 [Streptomyces sp. yr375]|uniref:hypothetical protein n=1 Tax=Streptomyces sp. yr375 TaxID=1761906 RepID=UPI0008CE0C2C|nr:hypothetical protein [Streptomyces sp. yr375]SES47727.1 hypothetical protein SAMN04487983_106513 [Streptomyces sp. yr375]